MEAENSKGALTHLVTTRKPQKLRPTVLVLVTDLYEGGDAKEMRKRFASIVASGVQLIVLPALNDDGAPCYDKHHAEYLASLGVPHLPVRSTNFQT